jgi:hypothetical protein
MIPIADRLVSMQSAAKSTHFYLTWVGAYDE